MFIHHFTKGGYLVPFLGDPHKEGVFEGTVCGVKITLFINCHITFYLREVLS